MPKYLSFLTGLLNKTLCLKQLQNKGILSLTGLGFESLIGTTPLKFPLCPTTIKLKYIAPTYMQFLWTTSKSGQVNKVKLLSRQVIALQLTNSNRYANCRVTGIRSVVVSDSIVVSVVVSNSSSDKS